MIPSNNKLIESGVIALGLVIASWVLGNSLLSFKKLDRSVEVKGLAERDMQADTAILPIGYGVTGNELGQIYAAIESRNSTIINFLQTQGIKPADISVSPPSIIDRQAQDYGNAELASRMRYAGKSVVTVYTKDVPKVREILGKLGELGRQDIVLNTSDYENRPSFMFTGLNALKPAMIEEATRNARTAADKFAKDSDSTIGKIKRANQGQFSIEDRDQSTPHIKKIRVVSTVEFYLAD